MTTTDAPATPAAPRAPRRRRWVRVLALVLGVPVLVLALGYGALRILQPHRYSGTVMQAPTAAPPMDDLVGDDGTPVDLAAYSGDIVIVYFGYTYCPDVCPTTLTNIARAMRELGGTADRVHVMMLTVDPERDTPERLHTYMDAFDPEFLGVTGDRDALERVAAEYGVFFARGEDLPDGGYAVDHTASVMAIDTKGHLRIIWPTEVTADDLASDVRALL